MSKLKSLNISRETIYLLLLGFAAFSITIGYRLSSVSIILLAVFYVSDKQLFSKMRRMSFRVTFFYFAYFLIHIFGLIVTENLQEGSEEVTVKLSFLILPLIIFTEKVSKNNLHQLFVTFKYWLVILAVFLIYHKLFLIGGPLFTLPSISLYRLTGIHHAYFSLFYMFSLFFLFHQINKKKIDALLGYAQILFFIFFIAVLGARVMFGLALLFSLIFFITKIAQFKGVKRIVLFLLLGLAIFFVYNKTNISEKFSRLSKVEWNLEKNIYNHQVFTFGYDANTSNTLEMRLIKWYCAWEIIKENTMIGVGTGDFKEALVVKYHEIDFKKGMVYKYNTHNQFIEEFLKFGILGGLFFLVFIGFIFYQAIKSRNVLLMLTMVTLAAFMMVESIFERQHGVVFFTLFVSLMYLYPQLKPNSTNDD